MLTAIRRTVQVNAEGVIEIRAPELTPGQQAEVIVLVETVEAAAQRAERVAQLAAFFKRITGLATSADSDRRRNRR